MLKRRIGSIVLSAAMLAGTVAVPVSARHVVREDVAKQKTLISQSLKDLNVSKTLQNELANIGEDDSLQVKRLYPYGGSIAGDSEGLLIDYSNGAELLIKNADGSTSIKKGDVVTVSFKVKNETDMQKDADCRIAVSFDGRAESYNSGTVSTGKKSRFTPKESNKYDNTLVRQYPYENADKAYDGRIAVLNLTRGKYGMSNKQDTTWDGAGQKMSTSDWNDVKITINTKDDDYEGQQTLKIEVSYTEEGNTNTSYMKGLFDADYTGTEDTSYDVLDAVSSLRISSNNGGYPAYSWEVDGTKHNVKYRYKDVDVSLDTLENKVTGAVSDIEEVVIDEPLTNLGVDENWKGGYNETFVGNSKTVSTKTLANWSQASHMATADGLKVSYGNGGKINFKNPSTSTDVKEGDIVKISFKAKNTAGTVGTLVVNFSDRSETTCSDQAGDRKATDGKKSRFTPIDGDTEQVTYSSNGQSKTERSQILSYPRLSEGDSDYTGRIMSFNMKEKKYGISNKFNWITYQTSQRLSGGEWNDITVTINTKDASYEGKQTMKIEASYPNDESTYKSYMKGYFDADYKGSGEDTTYDMLDKIGSLTISSNTGDYPCYGNKVGDVVATFKDVKVTVTHQVLEAWGEATVEDNIEGALADDKFLTDSELEARAYVNPTETNTMLIAAVYDENGVLIDCQTAKQGEDFNGLLTAKVSTEGAKTVKMFAVDSTTLAPKLVSKTLTASESNINANSAH